MQKTDIISGGKEILGLYETIPISFTVDTRLRVTPEEGGLGGLRFIEERLRKPYQKDYDELESPSDWPRLFDISNWEVALLYAGEELAGGVTVAWNTDEVHMLEKRHDLALVWDIRVAPAFRQKGLGKKLFHHAESWAREKGCCLLKVETQNTNVRACRFYAAMGCRLEGINFHAYDREIKVKGDVQFLWYKEIGARR
ncbi:MAG TPA: GNAT family N-acetyltransferase [Candidatus Mcinerneyibacteriales bacterium]|nr:GNAT family N-acetyltransferase [Candidatus Mcinerneyibacteriales bacterium]